MSRYPFGIVCAVLMPAAWPGWVHAGDSLADQARAVFATKCARCHGPDRAKPKGGFGHVLDLQRLASDPNKIVPFKPDESDLWQQVHNDEMPPPDSPSGPLTAQQKETIRAWIAAGAPTESRSSTTEAPLPQDATDPPSPSLFQHTLFWLGRFHVAVVHFPIALLLAALAGESWSVWKRTRKPSPEVHFCLALAALSAVPAVVLGWLFAWGGHGTSNLLDLHRWLGTITGCCAVALAVSSAVDRRRGVRSWSTRGLLLAAVGLVSIAAHFGGLMVHGEDFYDW